MFKFALQLVGVDNPEGCWAAIGDYIRMEMFCSPYHDRSSIANLLSFLLLVAIAIIAWFGISPLLKN